MDDVLDNIIWYSLTGAHASFAQGNENIRRYSPGFPGFIGFKSDAKPNLEEVAPLCARGEQFYCQGWIGELGTGWTLDRESSVLRMLWHGSLPDTREGFQARPLAREHIPQAVELASLTQPGPFGPRVVELGDYFGYFEGPRLISMAGERLNAGAYREISGVCTHPDFQGRGLARQLVMKFIRRQMLRGQTPILHVAPENLAARRLYERMGFRVYRDIPVRIITRT